ncbi:hypothetical protein Goklo_021005, partial [Gossypium klotzschianum]|nr:hypothetical protein [Gossypium klotzschianum]
MSFSPTDHSNPNPNSIFFPENPDPMADFELSDYLMLDAGVFEDDTSEKGMGVANESATPKHKIEAMDDGYKWRKYGKKSVKNSPNP